MRTKIGIIGQGFVGNAIYEGLKNHHEVCTFDIDKTRSMCKSLGAVVKRSRVIFVCLPTPMNEDGSCDISIVKTAIEKINRESIRLKSSRVVVIKSTIPPGTTAEINKCLTNVDVVFSPEFLTEANSVDDFKNQGRIILGGSRRATSSVKMLFQKAFPDAVIVKTTPHVAEMVKYITNCFLASKVIFANQMYETCKKLKVSYPKVVECAVLDDRIGASHLQVPGPDGQYGFGGHCFPKDIMATINFSNNAGAYSDFLQFVWDKNIQIREDLDWQRMIGRAVVEKKI